MKKHLLEGVKKGAFDESAAEAKFEQWLTKKKMSLQDVKNKERETAKATAKTRLEAEKEVNKTKADVLSKKRAELAVSMAQKAAAEAAKVAAAEAAEIAEISETPETAETPSAE
jgi:small subunit ribosomal protein S16